MHSLMTLASEAVEPGRQLILPGPAELTMLVGLLVLVGVVVAVVLVARSSRRPSDIPPARELPPPPLSHVEVLERRVADIERRLEES